LRQAGFEDEEIHAALADLVGVGLIEDGRFAREVVRDQARRRLSGQRSIRATLRQRGVDDAIIEEALAGAGDEAARARELVERRIERMIDLGPETASRRLHALLLRRGYDPETARTACREAVERAFQTRGQEEL
jgi:regulatory protein